MAANFVAAIDHGTTSTRCILFDRRGAPIAIAQRAQTMHYPRPGWVELDMEEVWNRTQECIHEALRAADAAPADVAAIGITNERESVVLWDRRTGRPVAHAIVWQDTRTAAAPTRWPPTEASTVYKIAPAADLDVLLRLKLGWLLDRDRDARGRRPGTSCSARRYVAALESHRRSGRRGARNGSDERLPHPPHEPAHAQVGSVLLDLMRIPRAASRDPLFE